MIADATRAKLRSAAREQWADPAARARILVGQRTARLVRDNLRLCRWLARRFVGTGLDMDDLAQAAFFGLVRAAETYDPERGAFSSWFFWHGRSAIQREVAQTRSTIRVPQYQPASAGPRALSLAAPVGDAELGSLLVDGNSESPPDCAGRELLRETVATALGTLRPRDAEIVSMRFGINGAEYPHTLEEIARRFDLTRERIRQIEGRALDRLRFRLSGE